MSNIIRPVRWWDWVSPQGEQEMIPFIRAYMGKGKQFRTPKRMWEDLWRLKRGELNHVMGIRKAPTITNFKGPKYQKGMIVVAGAVYASGGTEPNLQNITNSSTNVSPTPSRQQYAYDSDGSMEHSIDNSTEGTIAYTALTTQTDDSNTHTNDWWPDQAETNEGLNWDIQYNTVTSTLTDHLLADNTGVDRTISTWYLLDTVSNDHADATHDGGIGCNRTNGTSKNPNVGTGNLAVDVDIRATGTGSAVTTHTYDLDCVGSSDIRLKKNIVFIREVDNIRIYTWDWNATAIALGITDSTVGVLAQEVQKTHPDAVFTGEHKYLKVNYSKIFS